MNLGPVCKLGNVNGCPEYPACDCFEQLVRRMQAENERLMHQYNEAGTRWGRRFPVAYR